jgi:hypothetical protein
MIWEIKSFQGNILRSWFGGEYQVPFEGGQYSSMSMGYIPDSADIAEMTAVLGKLTSSDFKEIYGSLIFNGKDLDFCNETSLQKSFLKLLPNKLTQFINFFSQNLSIMLLQGPHLAKITENGSASGYIIVDKPEYFTIGQKIELHDSTAGATEAYISAIDMNTHTSGYNNSGKLSLVTARGGSTAVDCSGYLLANASKVYIPGARSNGFTSIRSQLLSAANGGDATILGQTKTSYPYLQALNVSGSSVTSSTIMDDLYDFFFDVSALGKGNPIELWMDFKNFKTCIKNLELNRQFAKGDSEAGFGFRSINLLSDSGSMKLVAIREMPSSEVFAVDPKSLLFAGSKMFEREKDPAGNEWYHERDGGSSGTGHSYIIDIKGYGNIVPIAPSRCGVLHSISYT